MFVSKKLFSHQPSSHLAALARVCTSFFVMCALVLSLVPTTVRATAIDDLTLTLADSSPSVDPEGYVYTDLTATFGAKQDIGVNHVIALTLPSEFINNEMVLDYVTFSYETDGNHSSTCSAVSAWTDVTGYDSMHNADFTYDESYSVTGIDTGTLGASGGEEDKLNVAYAYDAGPGMGNVKLLAITMPTTLSGTAIEVGQCIKIHITQYLIFNPTTVGTYEIGVHVVPFDSGTGALGAGDDGAANVVIGSTPESDSATILNYQGRLLDASSAALGGAGTDFCFRFSLWDQNQPTSGDSEGTQLWPTSTPSTMTVNVTEGVFNVAIGDIAAGGDVLDLDFSANPKVYLKVEVAAQVSSSCSGVTFETLYPRKKVGAAAYAMNASKVAGYLPAQSATGNQIPVLTSGNLILGGTNPQINTTGNNTLYLQYGKGGTGSDGVTLFGGTNGDLAFALDASNARTTVQSDGDLAFEYEKTYTPNKSGITPGKSSSYVSFYGGTNAELVIRGYNQGTSGNIVSHVDISTPGGTGSGNNGILSFQYGLDHDVQFFGGTDQEILFTGASGMASFGGAVVSSSGMGVASSTVTGSDILFQVQSGIVGSDPNTSTPYMKFSVDADGNVSADGDINYGGALNSATYADLAENYPVGDDSIEAGDLVAMTQQTRSLCTPNGTSCENVSVFGKTQSAYDQNTFGVVSTKPGIVLYSGNKDRTRPIALAGRVPVKISDENGALKVGDPIAASSIAGVGMKATRSGYIVGTALEPYSGSGQGKIMIYVNPRYWYAGGAGAGGDSGIFADYSGFSLDTLMQREFAMVSEIGQKAAQFTIVVVESFKAKIAVVEQLYASVFTVTPDGEIRLPVGENQITGSAKILAGTSEVVIPNTHVTADSKIMVTPLTLTDMPLVVTVKTDGVSFTVAMIRSAPQDINFDWVLFSGYATKDEVLRRETVANGGVTPPESVPEVAPVVDVGEGVPVPGPAPAPADSAPDDAGVVPDAPEIVITPAPGESPSVVTEPVPEVALEPAPSLDGEFIDPMSLLGPEPSVPPAL